MVLFIDFEEAASLAAGSIGLASLFVGLWNLLMLWREVDNIESHRPGGFCALLPLRRYNL